MDGVKILLRVMRQEIAGIFASRLMILLVAVLPFCTMALFTAMFRQAVPENLPVAVCDRDGSGLSRSIVRMVAATPAVAVIPVEDLAEGRRAVLSGRAYGVLVIPEHMEREVMAGRAPVSRFYVNNQIMLPAAVAKRAMMNVYATTAAGLKLSVMQARGIPESQARERVAAIHINAHILFNPNLDYRWLLHVSLCPFLIKVFVMCATAWGVGGEIKRGRVSLWLRAAEGRVGLALLGKLVPLTLWFSLVGWAMLGLFFGMMELPLPKSLWALAAGIPLYVVSCQAVALLMVAFTEELAMTVSLVSLYAGTSFAFAGVTFPSAAMPLAGRVWHNLLPLSHLVQLINDQTLRRLAPADSLGTLGVFLAIGLVCGGVAWVKFYFRFGGADPEVTKAGGAA